MKSMASVFYLICLALPLAAGNYVGHGIALHGDLKYGPEFTHFEYVNSQAPKGGAIRLAAGPFDSFNPFILKGITPPRMGQLIYESLLAGSDDEPFSAYGRLAESIEIDEDVISKYPYNDDKLHLQVSNEIID